MPKTGKREPYGKRVGFTADDTCFQQREGMDVDWRDLIELPECEIEKWIKRYIYEVSHSDANAHSRNTQVSRRLSSFRKGEYPYDKKGNHRPFWVNVNLFYDSERFKFIKQYYGAHFGDVVKTAQTFERQKIKIQTHRAEKETLQKKYDTLLVRVRALERLLDKSR